MRTKYGARRTFSQLCGREFASKAEAIRAEELRLMELAGAISGLEYQVTFVLSVKPKVTITVDFAYKERLYDDPVLQKAGKDGSKIMLYSSTIYEDSKTGILTRDFRTKMAWLKQLRGIEVRLTSPYSNHLTNPLTHPVFLRGQP